MVGNALYDAFARGGVTLCPAQRMVMNLMVMDLVYAPTQRCRQQFARHTDRMAGWYAPKRYATIAAIRRWRRRWSRSPRGAAQRDYSKSAASDQEKRAWGATAR